MEQLINGYTLEISKDAFPLSTDSMLLSGFVKLPRNAAVLDLGSGCGTLGLLLCAEHADCHVTGIELDENAHTAALGNIARNGLTHRMDSLCADLRQHRELIAPGSFSCTVSNPPYFASGPESKRGNARREDCCTMQALFEAAAWSLKYGGDFFLVHRPERLAELFYTAAAVKLEPKRLCLARYKPDSPVSLVLVQCRKGGKPGLSWEEIVLQNADGTPSGDYRKLYHL